MSGRADDGGGARVYRWLLRLLPRRLRRRHGEEMEASYLEARARASEEHGRLGRVRVFVAVAWDVVRRAAYERVRLGVRRVSPRVLAASLLSDLRFALRGFMRSPGITFVAVLMISLGVAATASVFALIDGVLLRPLPFPAPDRLVYLDETAPRWNLEFTSVSYADFHVWRENARAFEAMGLSDDASYNIAGDDGAERVSGLEVTHDFDDALGIEPVLGRTFTPEEDRPGGPPVVVIGHDLWRARFGADRGVLGRTLVVNGVRREIVGVLPPEAEFPGEVDLWTPLAEDPATAVGSYSYKGVGRLEPGVTIEQARDDLMRAHAAVWEERDPDRTVSPVVMPLRDRLVGDFRAIAVVLGAAVALVLLVACANVASILLARSFARRRELGIRMALGAGAGRLARQLFTESAALSLVAGPLGLLLGFWSVRLLVRTLPEEVPPWIEIAIDGRMGLFALGVIAATVVLFGWAPVVQARRQHVSEAMSEGGGRAGVPRAQRRTMRLLVIGEITLATLLLVGGGLLLRTFDRLHSVNPGFRTENVLHFRVDLPEATYPDSAALASFHRTLLTRLEALPGARAAGAGNCPPMLGCHTGGFFEAEGAPRPSVEANPVVLYRFVSPGYFEALGIRLAHGRHFRDVDGAAGPPSVVVNETFAREFFPDVEDPVGRRIRFHGNEAPWFRVVGVTRDVKHYGLDEPMRPGLYFPLEPRPQRMVSVLLWTALPPTSLVPQVREVVRDLDPQLPLFSVSTTAEVFDRSLAVRRAYSWMMAVFAGMALVLALGGIYGVLSFLVGQRVREIGVRVALGASRADVVWLIARQGVALALVGAALGLGAAFAAGRALSDLLVGVSTRDPFAFGGAAVAVALTALLAALAPARRAARVDPHTVLREE